MTNKDVANFFPGGSVPAISDLKTALQTQQGESKRGVSGGADILRVNKQGFFVYGADGVEVQEGSKWAVNPLSIETGFIAWKDGAPLEEHMSRIGEPLIMEADLNQDLGVDAKGKVVKWQRQTTMVMACTDGDDAGNEVIYKASNTGGNRAASDLIDLIVKQVDIDPEAYVPLITIDTDSYIHKQWGQIFFPVFEVIEFVGNSAGPATAAPKEEKKEEKPKRRTRKAAAPKAESEDPAAPEVEELPDDKKPARRTRRKRA